MRWLGTVLSAVGALVLAVQGFSYLGGGVGPAEDRAGWASPLVAGVAVVGGLLLLASDGRRDEAT